MLAWLRLEFWSVDGTGRMKRSVIGLALLVLCHPVTATGVFEHFRESSRAYDFGECNAMLVLRDFTADGRPDVLLSHFEHRVGGVHIWHVYTPLDNGGARFLGNVDFHPRGLRAYPGETGFLTYAGEVFGKWRFDAKGLHADGQVSLDTARAEAVPFWAQRCPDDAESYWAGANDAAMRDVRLDAEVINGADHLVEAAETGDLLQMKTLLDDWVAMYAAENAGGKALVAAATAGRSDSLNFLFGRSESHPDPVFRETLRAAAWNGHASALKEILAQDLGEARPELLQDALGAASHGGKNNVVQMLLAEGANANAPTSKWQPKTPLELATESKHDSVVEAMRSAGVNVQRSGEVALFDAIHRGDEAAVRALIDQGVSTGSVRPGNYPTPALIWSIIERQPAITMALLETGADVSVTTPHDDTALIKAAEYGYTDIVIELLERGANAGATNHIRVDALTGAAGYARVDVVRTLLARAVEELPDRALDRALVAAAYGGHDEVVCMLLTAGADPTWKNERRRTAATTASMARKTDTVALLNNWESICP